MVRVLLNDGKTLKKIESSLESCLPTQCLDGSSMFTYLVKQREVLEIARVGSQFPFLTTSKSLTCTQLKVAYSVSIVLALNKESTLIDPFNWTAFKDEILAWAATNRVLLEINESTDLKFRERTVPSHPPRSRPSFGIPLTNVYSLFSSTPPRSEFIGELVSIGAAPPLIRLISRINRHPPLLSSVGIIPNQVRLILKETTQHFDEAFEDISFTLLSHGYQIWKTRKRLMSNYWKEIAPEEWKPFSKNDSK